MQELIKEGRRGMQETEATLSRTEKLVEDTMQIGQQVRAREGMAGASSMCRPAHGGGDCWGCS
jgi:hypothetical protein